MAAEIFVGLLVFGVAAWVIAWSLDLTPNQQKKKAVKARQVGAEVCPHCQQKGAVVPATQAAHAPKLHVGIFALGVWNNYQCTSCNYKW